MATSSPTSLKTMPMPFMEVTPVLLRSVLPAAEAGRRVLWQQRLLALRRRRRFPSLHCGSRPRGAVLRREQYLEYHGRGRLRTAFGLSLRDAGRGCRFSCSGSSGPFTVPGVVAAAVGAGAIACAAAGGQQRRPRPPTADKAGGPSGSGRSANKTARKKTARTSEQAHAAHRRGLDFGAGSAAPRRRPQRRPQPLGPLRRWLAAEPESCRRRRPYGPRLPGSVGFGPLPPPPAPPAASGAGAPAAGRAGLQEQSRKMHGLEKLIKNACNRLLSVFTSFGTGNSRFK